MKNRIRTLGYVSPVILLIGLGVYYINGLWDMLSIGLAVLGAACGIIYLVVCFDDLRQAFSARSFRSGTNSLLIVCLMLSLLVFVNMIGYRSFVWKDITIASKFELSPLTQAIISDIRDKKQDIYFTSFFWTYVDRNLTQEQNQALIRQNRERENKLRDLFGVYGSVTSNFHYRFLDPNKELMLARQYNIQRYRGNVTIVEYGDYQEMVTDMDNEEQVTNALIRATSGEQRKVYFLEGHQELDIIDGGPAGFVMARTAISDQSYVTERLNVMEAGGVPRDCRALLIVGPRKPFLPEEIRLIDDYLERGGRVMVCLDPEYESGLGEWLLSWGVRVDDDIVVDNSAAGVRQGAGPTEPLLYSYDKVHPITKFLMKAYSTMPTVRSVRLVDSPPPDIELTVLARTSDNSWGERDRNAMTARNPTFDPTDLSGPVPVAVAMLKKIEETEPGLHEISSTTGSRAPTKQELEKIKREKSQTKAELVVFGDSQFASNSYLRYGGNWDLFMNAVNWLIGDERLITIRPKDPEDQTIYINQRQSNRMALMLQYALPALLVIFGTWVWVVRRFR